MSLKPEAIKQAVLLLENVIEKSKEQNQVLISEELEEIQRLLQKELDSKSINFTFFVRLIDFLLQVYELLQR